MAALVAPSRIAVDTQTIDEARAALARGLKGAHVDVALATGQTLRLPEKLASTLFRALEALAGNGAVTVSELPEELSTVTAADTLGVSRPTVVKWAAEGKLPSHKVGSHTRFFTKDVLAFRAAKLQSERDAFAALRELEMEHNILD